MKNMQIALIFKEIADILQILGENEYKVRAYRRAVQAIQSLDENILVLHQQGRLLEIEGIGRELARKIADFLDAGSFEAYDQLKKRVPTGLLQILNIPGLGPKSVRLIYEKLGISSLEELEAAVQENKIRTLPGLGSKTEVTIMRGIEMLQRHKGKVPLGLALGLANNLQEYLELLPSVRNISLAGSVRRWRELVSDVDLVVATSEPSVVVAKFLQHPCLDQVLEQESDRVLARTHLGIKVELVLVSPEEYALTVFRNTGSKDHWKRLEQIWSERGLSGQTDLNGSGLDFEKGFYNMLGLEYIPPELREGQGEIEAASQGTLPCLLEPKDIRGDLHVHTNWSDGVHNLVQMADAAKSKGYEYIAITDHSKSLAISHGLREEQVLEQQKLIAAYNQEHPDFRVLAGIEVDILSNSTLDFSDDFLKDMDLVVASIHSGFKQPEKQLTDRVLSALKNEHVDIIAHPTGRLLARREAYALDLEQVFQVAAETHTALEINASPDRLDLNDLNCRSLVKQGGLIAINTDAHDWQSLGDMQYGIMMARRGWVESKSVVNSWPLKKLLRWLKR